MKNIIAIVKCLKLQLFIIFFLVITKMLYQSENKTKIRSKYVTLLWLLSQLLEMKSCENLLMQARY